MLDKMRRRMNEEEGFTLIELLVVILIIGILAAIAIPAFLNQRNKANDATAKSDVKTAQTAAETYATDQAGPDNYASLDGPALVAIEPTLTDANGLAAAPTTGNKGYTISVTSKSNDGTVFTLTRSDTGAVSRTCDKAGTGGCKTGGLW